MAEANPPAKVRSTRRRAALIATYLGVAAVGFGLGAHGLLPYGPLQASTSTPLARVGLALSSDPFHPNADTAGTLSDDLALVRAGFSSPEREVFDLVTALRGLNNGGNLDAAAAAQSCRELKMPRCDDQALAVLRKLSRP